MIEALQAHAKKVLNDTNPHKVPNALAFRDQYFKTHDPKAPCASMLAEIAFQKLPKCTHPECEEKAFVDKEGGDACYRH
jgi:hypothetical protein